MKRLLFSLAALAMMGAALVGCRGSVDVDPHGSTSVNTVR